MSIDEIFKYMKNNYFNEMNEDVKKTLLEAINKLDKKYINKRSEYDIHLIDFACNKFTYLIEPLLKKGANPNVMDKKKITPLHRLALHNFMLSSAFGDFDTFNKQYNDSIKLMIKHGARFDVKDIYEQTPLHIFAEHKDIIFFDTEIINLLIKSKTNLNIQDSNKNTILHIICNKIPNTTIIQNLLKAGCDPNILNKKKYTVLDVLLKKKEDNFYEDLILIIQSYDGKVNKFNIPSKLNLKTKVLSTFNQLNKHMPDISAMLIIEQLYRIKPYHKFYK